MRGGTMSYDVIVLGGGPAGLAAAVAARGRNKTVLVIGNRWEDSPLAKAEKVDNYLGLPGMTGREILEHFRRHAEGAGVECLTGRAISLMPFNGFTLTVGSDIYHSRALVLAPGVVRQTKFPGEREFLGRGVSYCATCDGMLYRGKRVVVVGKSREAPEEARFLKSIGCQVTYTAPQRPEELDDGIPFVKAARLEVRGGKAVSSVLIGGEELPCDALFILRSSVAPTDLLPQLETEGGYIKVDRRLATNVPGVFAAGDCTGGPLQVAKAVGEGHVAGLSVCEYLDNK